MQLTQEDQAKLAGEYGAGVHMAMSIIVHMAEISQVQHLMDISAAHIDSAIYMGEATLEFAERLVSLGARVSVPSTLNVSGLDEHGWHLWNVPSDWAKNALRQMHAYQQMGCVPIWTCAPYQTNYRPKFGQQIAWGESNAIAFINSVVGARTERYPDLLDICAAITGRVPAAGLHITENRAGQLLFRLVDVPLAMQESDLFYPVLGYILGQESGEKIPVVEGITTKPQEDQLKALGAAAASAGGIALYHLIGITPEALTAEKAFQGGNPERIIELTPDQLIAAYKHLTTTDNSKVHLVALGCPHFSIHEFEKLAALISGKHKHPDTRFLVTSNRWMIEQARQNGYTDQLTAFGAEFSVDACILTSPMLPQDIKTIMTNSGKYAYYTPGLLSRQIIFASIEECVHSAIEGHVVRDNHLWQ